MKTITVSRAFTLVCNTAIVCGCGCPKAGLEPDKHDVGCTVYEFRKEIHIVQLLAKSFKEREEKHPLTKKQFIEARIALERHQSTGGQ